MAVTILAGIFGGLAVTAIISLVAFFVLIVNPARLSRKLQRKIEAREVHNYEVHEKLKAHSDEFVKEIIEVTPGCHVAVGYGLANCVLLEGDDACILIDALESVEAGDEMVAAFSHILEKKPIKAIVITHFHTDHSYGIEAFVRGREDEVKIYAHASYHRYLDELSNVRAMISFKRGMFQFGPLLKCGERENCGIGPLLKMNKDTTESKNKSATHTFQDRLVITEGGITLDLIHSPGETNDQVNIWWEDRKVFFAGDNIYRAFPNLYAIRGTAARDTNKWSKAVDLMRSYEPEILVPQHSRPLVGKAEIMETLTAYRDGIQFVHDQTVRYINKGYDVDRVASLVKLPPTLAEHPFLLEFYGSVDWSVRGIFSHYLGVNRGKNFVHLNQEEMGDRLVRLGGGAANVLDQAKAASDKGESRWALKMCDAILDCQSNGEVTASVKAETKILKSTCLRSLGEKEISANGRNWYFMAALENEGYVVRPDIKQVKLRIYLTRMADAFQITTTRLCPKKSADTVTSASFYFTDLKEHFTIHIRRGVAEISHKDDPSASLRVTSESLVWQEICARDRSPLWAYLTGQLSVRPTILHLAWFMSYFDQDI
jgi:alkyl sulfatase BDS1-like metallo-beta-lactamase superfamily hydrolase